MQFQFQGFKATRPVARVSDIQKQYYEVYFLVYTDGRKIPMRYKKNINRLPSKSKRKLQAEDYAEALWEALTSGWNPLRDRYPEFENELRQQKEWKFNEALDYCLKEKQKTLAHGSFITYRSVTKAFQTAATNAGYSNKKIKLVERKDIRLIIEQARDDNNWNSKSRNQKLLVLKALLSVLVDKDIIAHNPAHQIKAEKQPEKAKYKRIPENERERIVEHLSVAAPHFLDFIYCIYDTGIRPKELLLIQLSDINIIKREITVRAEVAKNNKERVIPITDDMLSILLRRDVINLDKKLYLFSNDKFSVGSKPFWPSAGRRWWKKYVQKDLGIDAKLYGMKHTGADSKLLAGIDTRTLKSLYGHSSEQMTENYLEQLQEIHKQKIIANAPSLTAKVIPIKIAK